MEARPFDTKGGYITLMSVLVASAVIVSIFLSILTIGTNVVKTSITNQSTKLANVFARSCVDEALGQIRNSASFEGSGSLSFDKGMCDYNVINIGGQNRIVNASGTSALVIQRISVSINAISPQISVSSWQEVSGF